MYKRRFSRSFLILLLVLITGLFLWMIRAFLLTLLMAAIVAGLASPLYQRLLSACRGRRSLASVITLLLLLLLVLVPLSLVLGSVVKEAYEISQTALPWIQARLEEPDLLVQYLQNLPGADRLLPYREQILQKAGELAGSLGNFLVDSLSATTRGTVTFLIHLGILLYSLFFFLMDGTSLLQRILGYLPLAAPDAQRLVDRFTSVARATVKGTLFIGLAQGSLAGLAFAIVGIPGAFFWGTVMTLLSVIPGPGSGLIWLPAGIFLIIDGRLGTGIGLLIFCGLVVGSIDNVLRPRLVGRDTQMHDLLILFSTLGGILVFGVLGIIVGPILAALFVTIWQLYGEAFADLLEAPEPASAAGTADPEPSPGPADEHKP
jgi:predicted PurR-regulated permease PerM